ncbi:MAG: hypothetical protein KatS3mg114_1010 [Planctomycetaceae bacterium]|nr:MAG: hypothetical protein KatS3mg114_1010 [Planctomycetaceae bacterium]
MTGWHQHELEEVACDHCGAEHPRPVVQRLDGLVVCECPRCGLAFLNPRPTADVVHRLYDAEYFHKASSDAVNSAHLIGYRSYHSAATRWLRNRIMQQRLDWLETLHSRPGRRLLEIGCATGEFAREADRRGWQVTAIDLSAEAIALAQTESAGIEYRVATAEQLATEGLRFDAIVACELIEHVLSPKRLLQACYAMLQPGGVCLLSTPNYRCARRLGSRWIGYHMSFEHLYFFSDETLSRMGQAAGLEPIIWKTTGSGVMPDAIPTSRRFLKGLLQHLRCLDLARELRTWWQGWHQAETYEWWGSGHTLLMVFQRPVQQPSLMLARAA